MHASLLGICVATALNLYVHEESVCVCFSVLYWCAYRCVFPGVYVFLRTICFFVCTYERVC